MSETNQKTAEFLWKYTRSEFWWFNWY